MILDKFQKLAALSFCTLRTIDQLEGASGAITLCPSEKHFIPAPILLEKQLARFTGAAVESLGLDGSLKLLFTSEVTLKPTKLIPFGKSYVFEFPKYKFSHKLPCGIFGAVYCLLLLLFICLFIVSMIFFWLAKDTLDTKSIEHKHWNFHIKRKKEGIFAMNFALKKRNSSWHCTILVC